MYKFKSLSAVLIVLMAAAGLAFAPQTVGDENRPSAPEAATPEEFVGNVVLLVVDKSTSLESDTESIVIKDPKIISVGKRYFIHGSPHLMEKSEEWFSGGAIGVSWDSVRSYWVFTPESYEKYEQYRRESADD